MKIVLIYLYLFFSQVLIAAEELDNLVWRRRGGSGRRRGVEREDDEGVGEKLEFSSVGILT